jgi:hypothetical protein
MQTMIEANREWLQANQERLEAKIETIKTMFESRIDKVMVSFQGMVYVCFLSEFEQIVVGVQETVTLKGRGDRSNGGTVQDMVNIAATTGTSVFMSVGLTLHHQHMRHNLKQKLNIRN